MIKKTFLRNLPLHFMIIPGMLIILIYSYLPMFGIVIAFQDFVPAFGISGSEWIGLDNFKYMLELPDIFRVVLNTIFISLAKIIAGIAIPVTFALLLNEVRRNSFKKVVQTVVYLPYFFSWVILGGILVDILSPQTGIINSLLDSLGIQPIFFLGDNRWFPVTLIVTNVWKEFGFSTVVYLADITGIDTTMYEAAVVDGAGRWKQTVNITVPHMMPIIILMTCLSLGFILNAGFDQIFNLYSPIVYESGDIIDTLVYRLGLVDAQYGVATAVGIFKSIISLILIALSYKMAYKFAGYMVF